MHAANFVIGGAGSSVLEEMYPVILIVVLVLLVLIVTYCVMRKK